MSCGRPNCFCETCYPECSDCGSRDCRYFGNCVYCHTDHRECEGCNVAKDYYATETDF